MADVNNESEIKDAMESIRSHIDELYKSASIEDKNDRIERIERVMDDAATEFERLFQRGGSGEISKMYEEFKAVVKDVHPLQGVRAKGLLSRISAAKTRALFQQNKTSPD